MESFCYPNFVPLRARLVAVSVAHLAALVAVEKALGDQQTHWATPTSGMLSLATLGYLTSLRKKMVMRRASQKVYVDSK